MKTYIKLFKKNKLIYIILLSSLVLSMCLMSVAFGTAIKQYRFTNKAENSILEYNSVVQLVYGQKRDYNKLSSAIKNNFISTYVTSDLIKSDENVSYNDVTAIGGNIGLGNTPPVYKGSFLKDNGAKNQIVLGKDIKYKKEKINVGDTIELFSQSFLVVGLLGDKSEEDPFSMSIYMLYKDIPQEVLDEVGNINLNITSNDKNYKKEIENFQKEMLDFDNESRITYKDIKHKAFNFFNLLMLSTEALKIWAICIINCFIMGYFSILPRKKEITLLRIFGATHSNIIGKFFKEYSLLMFVAVIASFMVQRFSKGFLDIIMGYEVDIEYLGFIYSFLSTAIIVYFVVFITILNSLRVKPIINIK